MPLESINLRKLLRLMMADPKMRITLLREDIRSDERRQFGDASNGGDFFVPFWAAARSHAKGDTNLEIEVAKLIAANPRRARLYALLSKSFLEWWNEKRAWRNEPFFISRTNIKAKLNLERLGLIVKVENLLSGTIGEEEHRLVYPYFAEEPALSLKGARLGVFLFNRAFPDYAIECFRILDVLRGRSYSAADVPLQGNEIAEIAVELNALRAERERLEGEYV